MSNTNLDYKSYPANSNNYTVGRAGRKIEKVTIHHMAGILTAKQCGSIFQDESRHASSNYGIGKNGEIGLYVDEANTSYADANLESNRTSVTIECSNQETGGDWKVSDKVLNKLIDLITDIFKRNEITKAVKGETITWHSMYSATTCPGDYLRSKIDYICKQVNIDLGNTVEIIEKPITTVTVTTEKGLNLRKEANTSSSVLGAFSKGTIIPIYEVKKNWGRTDGGWICLDYTSYKNNTDSTSKKYTVGRYKVTAEILTVRTGAGTNYDWKKFSELTANAQEQIVKLCGYKPNGLCKRVICDVSKVDGNWGQIPSGWICLDYCEKV